MKTYAELPVAFVKFLEDLDGALGDRLVGIILYGSWANGKKSPESDLDITAIVSDADAERSRQEIFRVLGTSEVDRNMLSLSVESYMRIKDFLKRGDPFAWVVCSSGIILRERNNLLTNLQKLCQSQKDALDSVAVEQYLQSKSTTHYMQAMQALNQFFSNIQLSQMASAQAVATRQNKGQISSGLLVKMADWEYLKEVLQEASATRREVESVEQLIMAHKAVRRADREKLEYPGKELFEGVRTAGELWTRLLASK